MMEIHILAFFDPIFIGLMSGSPRIAQDRR